MFNKTGAITSEIIMIARDLAAGGRGDVPTKRAALVAAHGPSAGVAFDTAHEAIVSGGKPSKIYRSIEAIIAHA